MAETITLHHSAVASLDRLAWSGWRIRLPVRRSAGQLRLSAPGQPAPQAPAHLREIGISAPRGNDVIEVPPPDGPAMGRQVGQRDDAGMALIVERFARRGQVVCDPVLLDRRAANLGSIRFNDNFDDSTWYRNLRNYSGSIFPASRSLRRRSWASGRRLETSAQYSAE